MTDETAIVECNFDEQFADIIGREKLEGGDTFGGMLVYLVVCADPDHLHFVMRTVDDITPVVNIRIPWCEVQSFATGIDHACHEYMTIRGNLGMPILRVLEDDGNGNEVVKDLTRREVAEIELMDRIISALGAKFSTSQMTGVQNDNKSEGDK